MIARALLGTLAILILLPSLGCASGERSVTFAGPRREAKLAVSAEPKDDDDDHVIIIEED